MKKCRMLPCLLALTCLLVGCGKGQGEESALSLTICGKELGYPFRYGELGEGMNLSEGVYFADADYTVCNLYQADGTKVCAVFFDGEQSAPDADALVIGIGVYPTEETQVSLCGLDTDSMEAWLACWDDPAVQEDTYLEYRWEEAILSVQFDERTGEALYVGLVRP